jgi:hypothetical protein
MDESQSIGAAAPDPPDEDSAQPSAQKRLKTPTAKALDLEPTEKLPQMVISDPLLVFIAKCIQADPDAWGVLLTTKHGKAGVASKFVKFLSNHVNPLTHGKSASTATVSSWIKKGMQKAEEETARRATAIAAGRGIADGSVPEVDKVWFELMEVWSEYLKEKPTTDRYTTPPEHLRGLVELKKDNSPLLPCGREEKAAGDAMREAAISAVAQQRDSARKDKPESKEHLKTNRRLKEEAPSGGKESDALLQAYISMEAASNQQEIRTAKVAELNQYTAMLANPLIPSDQKAVFVELLAGVSKELKKMQAEDAAASADGGGGGYSTPQKSNTFSGNAPSPAGSASSSSTFSSSQ